MVELNWGLAITHSDSYYTWLTGHASYGVGPQPLLHTESGITHDWRGTLNDQGIGPVARRWHGRQ